jgi:small subunit ribosomal protein S5
MGRRNLEQQEELDERVVHIARVAKVIKGGRRFAFRIVVVVGDNKGQIGIGVGKARSVPDAIRKGTERARRNMRRVNLLGTTIPHEVVAKFGGGAVRAVVEVAGIKDILTKSFGSANILNVAMATFEGLVNLTDPQEVARLRGRPLSEVSSFWHNPGR